jgi:hypothetical protein
LYVCHGHRDGGNRSEPTTLLQVSSFGGGARSVYHTVLPPPGNLSLHLTIQIPFNLEPHSCILCCGQFFYRSSGIDSYPQLPTRVYFRLQVNDSQSHFVIVPHGSAMMARALFIIVIINHSMLGYICRRTIQENTESIHDDGVLYTWQSDDYITLFQSLVLYGRHFT